MRLVGNFQNILKPTGVGIFILTIFSITFVVSYIFIDYQKYLKTYQASQIYEVVTLQKKTETVVENLKKLLCLAEVRIHAAHGNSERLQGILTSLHQLQAHQALPEFQKLSYTTLSIPYMTVTRFGVLPFDHTKITTQEKSLMNGEPLVKFGNKTIEGKIVILSLRGILEIEIDLTAFKRFLGSYETVDFDLSLQTKKEKQILSFPILLYSKTPDQFRVYAFAHKSHYAVFVLYAFLAAILIGFYLYVLDRHLQKNYQGKFSAFEDALVKGR